MGFNISLKNIQYTLKTAMNLNDSELEIFLILVLMMVLFIEFAIIYMFRKKKKQQKDAPMFAYKKRNTVSFMLLLRIGLFYIIPAIIILSEAGRPSSMLRTIVNMTAMIVIILDVLPALREMVKNQ